MNTWASAPAELIQELGLCLGTREWAAARLACRHWRRHVTAGVQLLELDLERSPHRWAMVTASVRRLFPRLRSVTLLVGTRVTPSDFSDRMAELALTIDLSELELRYVPLAAPRLGSALGDVRGVAELLGLKVLKLSGGPTPTPECIEALAGLRRLAELEVLPGDYGALHSDDVPPEGAESPVNYGLTDDHAAPMERLTALTSLLIKVKPEGFSAAGLASLASLPELQSLVVYDAELPSDSLAVLRTATKLTALQVGVMDVDGLSWLRALPQLQDLYLDTCSLEDARQLPAAAAAAAAAGPPGGGARALTGLYSVDQLFPTQEHFASLGDLTGLKELVLEGPSRALLPMWQPPPPPQHWGAPGQLWVWANNQWQHAPPAAQAAAAAAAAAHAAQQQAAAAAPAAGGGQGAGGVIDDDDDIIDGANDVTDDDEEFGEAEDDDGGAAAAAAAAPAGGGAPDAPGAAAAAGQAAAAAGQAAAAAGQGPEQLPGRALPYDLTPLSRLVDLEVLQLDKREEGDEFESIQLRVTPDVVRALAKGWTALNTLDLYNISPEELPSEAIAEMTRLTALRSLSLSCCPHRAGAPAGARRLSWWRLPPRLTALSLTGFDLSVADEGDDDWAQAPEARLLAHFGQLLTLRLHYSTLPPGMLPAAAPVMAEQLNSLSLVDVDGTTVEDMAALAQLTGLSTLRLLPRDHGLGGVAGLAGLRLKQLKLRLKHLQRQDLPVLSSLTTLFVLTLSAQMADGQIAPGGGGEVRVSEVERAVEGMPYCDVELEAEPALTPPDDY